ncbi:unknown [Coraliomargarita sp. CAG:312]|nr:unknown [Coraliomargarita sp. CAG:312]
MESNACICIFIHSFFAAEFPRKYLSATMPILALNSESSGDSDASLDAACGAASWTDSSFFSDFSQPVKIKQTKYTNITFKGLNILGLGYFILLINIYLI